MFVDDEVNFKHISRMLSTYEGKNLVRVSIMYTELEKPQKVVLINKKVKTSNDNICLAI